MDPKDVVHVLDNMVTAVRPSGVVLDLQVIRPEPRVECDGELICEALDEHDVRSHYASGPDLIDNFEDKIREVSARAMPRLTAIRRPVVIRERCRLRRLLRN